MMRGSLSPGVIARDCSPDFATPAGCWTSGLSGGTREKGGLEGVVNLAGDRGFESPLLQRRVRCEADFGGASRAAASLPMVCITPSVLPGRQRRRATRSEPPPNRMRVRFQPAAGSALPSR
jgi:hypothetical protein